MSECRELAFQSTSRTPGATWYRQRVATGERLPSAGTLLSAFRRYFSSLAGRLFPAVVDFIESPPSQPAATRHHSG